MWETMITDAWSVAMGWIAQLTVPLAFVFAITIVGGILAAIGIGRN